MVQIKGKKWDLLDDGLEVDYFHIYDKKLTSFKISDVRNQLDLTYKSWWAERDDFAPDPISVSREEENVEEDVFGYICMLNENKSSARNLFDLWTKNLGEDKG